MLDDAIIVQSPRSTVPFSPFSHPQIFPLLLNRRIFDLTLLFLRLGAQVPLGVVLALRLMPVALREELRARASGESKSNYQVSALILLCVFPLLPQDYLFCVPHVNITQRADNVAVWNGSRRYRRALPPSPPPPSRESCVQVVCITCFAVWLVILYSCIQAFVDTDIADFVGRWRRGQEG